MFSTKIVAFAFLGGNQLAAKVNIATSVYLLYAATSLSSFVAKADKVADVTFTNDASVVNTHDHELKDGATIENFSESLDALRISSNGPHAIIRGVNISPSKMADCTLMIGIYLENFGKGKGWVLGQEEQLWDRSIVMHDPRNGQAISSANGKEGIWQPWSNPQKPPVGQWIHVTATYRQGADCWVYLNGVRSDYSTTGSNDDGKDHLWVGSAHHANHHADAWIRNVKVFDTSLDENEVLLEKTIFFKSIESTSSPTTSPSIAPTTSLSIAPTSSPTSSPSIAPTSSPTTSPTSSSSIAPTTAPTSSPTMTPPKLNSWYIANNGNATEEVTSKDIITIFLPMNSTNRDTDALVFTKDCITPFSPNLFEAETTSPTSLQADGYIQFNTTLKMNVTAINRTTYWTPYADGTRGGWVEVCAETGLNFEENSDLGNGPVKTKVDFINNILNISVSLTATYEVNEVSAQREEATKEDVNTDYSGFITAYECDDTDLKNEKAATTYNQGDEITICVTDKSDEIVQVEEFVNLVVAQGGNNDYNFIRNGQWNPDITTPVCVDSNTSRHRVCYATIRALARFFSTESPAALTIRGSVYVRRDGRRVKQILRSALPTTENNNEEDALYDSSRRVQEDPESGEFEVKVGLVSTDNSAAFAFTVGSTVAGLMSVIVGVAGITGATLMV